MIPINRTPLIRFFIVLLLLAELLAVGVGVHLATAVTNPPSPAIPIRLASGEFNPLTQDDAVATLRQTAPAGNGYYIVQFQGPITEQDKQTIEKLGVVLFDYVPDYAFLARMTGTTAVALVDHPLIRWVGIYQPDYKLSPTLSQPTSQSAADAPFLSLNIVLFPGEDPAAIQHQLTAHGIAVQAHTQSDWRSKLVVQAPPDQLPTIAQTNGVLWVEPAPDWQLLNDVVQTDGILDVADVWDNHGYYGTDQIIAVADTHMDTGDPNTVIPDFWDCTQTTPRVTIINWGTAVSDTHGHGTAVAGSVLGNGSLAGSGCGNYSGYPAGMAPEAYGYIQATLNTTNTLQLPNDLNDLFQPAYDFGARLHNNSWGDYYTMGAYTTAAQEADQFTWDHKDFSIFFAAGNDGRDVNADGVVDLDSLITPATAKNVVTVGGTESNRPEYVRTWTSWLTPVSPLRNDLYTDNPNGMWHMSSRGPTDDGRYKPDIVAPGFYVRTTRSTEDGRSGDYINYAGTSFASPLVTGATAVARQVFSDTQTYQPSAAMLKSLITNGATDIFPGQFGIDVTPPITQEIPTTRPTNQAGWGRLDLEDSLFPNNGRRTLWWDSTNIITSSLNNLATGDVATYTFELLSDMPLAITLAWTDYPGTPVASGGLVNDLDLHLTAPDGTVFYPNNATQRQSSEQLGYAPDPNSYFTATITTTWAVRLTPSQYPVIPQFAEFLILRTVDGAGTLAFDLHLYDDSGTQPGSGNLLCSLTNQRAAWGGRGVYPFAIDLSPCNTTITSGDVYLVLDFATATTDGGYMVQDKGAFLASGRFWHNDGTGWVQDQQYDWVTDVVMAKPISPTTTYDRVNNLVGIDVSTPITGVYTMTVQGHNIPYGPQPYGLTISGDYRMMGNETVTRTIDGAGRYVFGNSGISMTIKNENVDWIAVTVHRDLFPADNPNDYAVNRTYAITTGGGDGSILADVSFAYEMAELNGLEETTLWAYQYTDAQNWQVYTVTVDALNNRVTAHNVAGFSTWALGIPPVPTAVGLQSTSIIAPATNWLWLIVVGFFIMVGLTIRVIRNSTR